MKIKIFSLLFCAAFSYGCVQEGNVEPIPILELALLDSIPILEETGFLTKPQSVEIVNDSLLICASFMGGGIWIFDIETGREVGSILSGEEMGVKFFPSAISVENFPTIEILDGLKGAVLVAELQLNEEQRLIPLWKRSILLDMPESYSSYPVKSFVCKLGSNYLVSLGKASISQSQPDYFEESSFQFGVFDSLGTFSRFLGSYPDELKNLTKPILPYEHYKAVKGMDKLYIAFPSSRSIEMYDQRGEFVGRFAVEKSRFSDFELIHLEKMLGTMDNPNEKMQSAYFSHLIESEEKVFVQTSIRDNTKLGSWVMNSAVMVYDKKNRSWSETDKVYDSWKLGRLAGVVNDTLYFVEASLNISETKYIKRAVLRPIDE